MVRLTPQKKTTPIKTQTDPHQPLSNFMKNPNQNYNLPKNNKTTANANQYQQLSTNGTNRNFYYHNPTELSNPKTMARPNQVYQQQDVFGSNSRKRGNQTAPIHNNPSTAFTPSKPVNSNLTGNYQLQTLQKQPNNMPKAKKVKVSHIDQFIRGGRNSIDNRVFQRVNQPETNNNPSK